MDFIGRQLGQDSDELAGYAARTGTPHDHLAERPRPAGALRELLETVDELKARGIHLVSLEERLDRSRRPGAWRRISPPTGTDPPSKIPVAPTSLRAYKAAATRYREYRDAARA